MILVGVGAAPGVETAVTLTSATGVVEAARVGVVRDFEAAAAADGGAGFACAPLPPMSPIFQASPAATMATTTMTIFRFTSRLSAEGRTALSTGSVDGRLRPGPGLSIQLHGGDTLFGVPR